MATSQIKQDASNSIGVSVYNNTPIYGDNGGTFAEIESYLKTHYVSGKLLTVRVTPNSGSNGIFKASSFTVIYCLSSANYGFGIAMSDNGYYNGFVTFRNNGGTFHWYQPSATEITT